MKKNSLHALIPLDASKVMSNLKKFMMDISAIDMIPAAPVSKNDDGKGIVEIDVLALFSGLSSGAINKSYNATVKLTEQFEQIANKDSIIIDYLNDDKSLFKLAALTAPVAYNMLTAMAVNNSEEATTDNDTHGWITELMVNHNAENPELDVMLANNDMEQVESLKGFDAMEKYSALLSTQKNEDLTDEVTAMSTLITDIQIIKYCCNHLIMNINTKHLGDDSESVIHSDFFNMAEQLGEFIPKAFKELSYSMIDSVTLIYFSLGGELSFAAKNVTTDQFIKNSREGDAKLIEQQYVYDESNLMRAISLYKNFCLNTTISEFPYKWSVSHLIPMKQDGELPSGDPATKYNPSVLLLTPAMSKETHINIPTTLQLITYHSPSKPLSDGSITDYNIVEIEGVFYNE